IFFLLARRKTIRRWTALTISIAISLSFSLAVALIPGSRSEPIASLLRNGDYHGDTALARSIGLLRFIRHFPTYVPHLVSVHSPTHPPGPVVFLAYLARLFPPHVVPRAAVLAFLSALVLIPTWFIAERL